MAKRKDEKELLAAPQEQPGTHRPQARRRRSYQRQSMGEAIAKSLIRSIASSLGRKLARVLTGRPR
jgi:Bacterial protein of unknown function (DUF853)